ncbi:MAG: orotidine-5'-phosphate decarboxylase [Deltaproteobacteria bacterium]|nr:orotidine-5'-phosphate decarboxylase [Deltaproteobacteria bacterium]
MKRGRDYIIFPLDVASLDDAKPLISELADYVGMFKVGLELFIRSGPDIIHYIKSQCDTGIFLDLKLHDIPVTVKRAAASIADLGVDLATVHCAESSAMLKAAADGSGQKVALLGVTILTSVSEADLVSAGYSETHCSSTTLVVKRALMAKSAGMAGVVCSGQEVDRIKTACGDAFLCVTPGIRPAWQVIKQDDQKRICTPAQAVEMGSDYLVIGRPIRDAADSAAAAQRIAEEIEEALKN